MLGLFPFLDYRPRPIPILLAIIGFAVIVGCKKPAEITRYQVPKEKPVITTTPPPVESESTTPGQDRMLAAIIPHGDAAWFFKLAGKNDVVQKHAESFKAVVQSVTFPESAGGKPQWKLPDGWQQQPGTQFRFATLTTPSEEGKKPLELTVTTLPWNSAAEQEAVLSNINRWRGQISLKNLSAAELEENIRKEKLPDGNVILVDLQGTLKDTGMRPPFAPGAGGTEK